MIAAIEQFLRDTAPPPGADRRHGALSPWVRAALPKASSASRRRPRLGVTGRHGGPIVPAGRFPLAPLDKGPRMRAALRAPTPPFRGTCGYRAEQCDAVGRPGVGLQPRRLAGADDRDARVRRARPPARVGAGDVRERRADHASVTHDDPCAPAASSSSRAPPTRAWSVGPATRRRRRAAAPPRHAVCRLVREVRQRPPGPRADVDLAEARVAPRFREADDGRGLARAAQVGRDHPLGREAVNAGAGAAPRRGRSPTAPGRTDPGDGPGRCGWIGRGGPG